MRSELGAMLYLARGAFDTYVPPRQVVRREEGARNYEELSGPSVENQIEKSSENRILQTFLAPRPLYRM